MTTLTLQLNGEDVDFRNKVNSEEIGEELFLRKNVTDSSEAGEIAGAHPSSSTATSLSKPKGSRTVSAIVSGGSLEEGKYFQKDVDGSGRVVFTPKISIGNGENFEFLKFVCNIIQLTTNGDYYIESKAEPTDNDIIAIFGQDCLVQVIKVDAVAGDSQLGTADGSRPIPSEANDSTILPSPVPTLPTMLPQSLVIGNTTTTSANSQRLHSHEEEIAKLKKDFENQLKLQQDQFELERQDFQKQIASLTVLNDSSKDTIQNLENERIMLENRIVEIESKLHQTTDTLMNEIDFISTKVLLLQEDYNKVCAEKAELECKLEKDQKASQGNATTESDTTEMDRNNNTNKREDMHNNSAERRPSAITRRPSVDVTDNNKTWNHIALSWLAPKGSRNKEAASSRKNSTSSSPALITLFHAGENVRSTTSSGTTKPPSTAEQTATLMRRLSKTSYTDVLLQQNNNMNSHIECHDDEYDNCVTTFPATTNPPEIKPRKPFFDFRRKTL